MAKRRRIPALEPNGLKCRRVDTYAERKRPREYKAREGEPWRKHGYGTAYQKARQLVMARTHGRCERCGATVAILGADGTWRSRGGEVHHVVPLCDGGTADPANLQLLCVSCHRLVDAARRRGEGSESAPGARP